MADQPRDTTQAAIDLAVAISRLRSRLREEAGVRQSGLSVSQLGVLGRIIGDGPITAAELAAAEHVSQQAIAQTLATLKAEGYVESKPDPKDGRKSLISATASGEQLRAALQDTRINWLVEAIDTAVSPAERAALDTAIALLERLAAVEIHK